MSYAIIRTGGKQFQVEPGATLRVPTMASDVNSQIEFETLLIADGGDMKIGESLAGAIVKATVQSHGRGAKIIVFKKKRRKQYKRKQGHRQGYTEIKIDSIG